MAVVALLALLAGSMGGLLLGRWQATSALAAAAAATALLAGSEAGALAALCAAGFLAGTYLHRVVAEQY
jgi:hypothetical protein